MSNDLEDIELDEIGGMPPDTDYDMEFLVRNRRNRISIQRQLLNEKAIEKGFRPVKSSMRSDWWNTLRPPEPVRSSLKPPMTAKAWRNSILSRIPILTWLWIYQLKWLIPDLISGVTVAIMHIPQGLAYSLLAGLPAVNGLYVSFVPVLVYTVFGSSRHVSVGTFAVVCLMVYNAILSVLANDPALEPCIGSSTDPNNDTIVLVGNVSMNCSAVKIDIAVTLSFLSGGIMLLMGILRLGFVTILLSESLVSGYTTGAAVHVGTSQLKHIFGVTIDVQRGPLNVPKTWIEMFRQIFNWPAYINTATVIISAISIAALIVFRIVDRKLLRKLKIPCWYYSREEKTWVKTKIQWPIPLPAQLIVVVIAAAVSFGANFHERWEVNIVEHIPQGLPQLTVPDTNFMLALLPDAFVIAVVTFAVTVSLGQVFAQQFDYSIASDQELLACGAMNMFGSLFSCFTAAGSLSRSTVQAVSGGKTQLVGVISSLIILVVLLLIGFLFEPLPNAVLASIIWVALYGMFSQMVDVWRYFKLSLADMLIWLVVFVATVLLGVDLGLGVGVGFSLFIIVFRTILPRSSVLGQVGNTEIYRNANQFEEIKLIPGVMIYRFQAPLCFVNCKVFLAKLALQLGPSKPQTDNAPGCFSILWTKLRRASGRYNTRHSRADGRSLASLDTEEGGNRVGRSRSLERALQNDVVDTLSNPSNIHTLVLDCGPVGFMDAMGVKTLKQLVLDYDKMGVQVLFASMTKENRDMLDRAGFFELCGKEWLFPSIQDAVNHAVLGTKLRPGDKEESLHKETTMDNNSEESETAQGNQKENSNSDQSDDDQAVKQKPPPADNQNSRRESNQSHHLSVKFFDELLDASHENLR